MKVQKEIVFQGIPDKSEYKETTSIKFKEDLIEFFNDSKFKNKTILELGTNHGHTTRVLSFLFENVITMDWREEPNLRMARELNHDRDNITYIQKNVYEEDWYIDEKIDVFFIDCVHDYDNVYSDIVNCCNISKGISYFIFDDYGLGSYYHGGGVKAAVDFFIEKIQGFDIVTTIGHSAGEVVRQGKEFLDSEGLICKYDNTWVMSQLEKGEEIL